MVVTIRPEQFDALGHEAMVKAVASEIPSLEPRLQDAAPALLNLIAVDAIRAAGQQGFRELPTILWFTLTMLTVHPRFAQQPKIRAHLAASLAAGHTERDRVADLVDQTAPGDWETAGRADGYLIYYEAVAKGKPVG